MTRESVKQTAEKAAETTQEQIDTLRRQVEHLVSTYVTPALLDAAKKTDSAVAGARKLTDHEIENVSTHVKSRPIAAILFSAVIGFIAGRFSK